jgi:DNA-binding CsgD family transcriptional regulator
MEAIHVTGPFRCGKDALDVIEKLNRTSTLDDAVGAIGSVFADFGFDYFCLLNMPLPEQRFEEVMHAIRIPSEWLEVYLREDYVQIDPMLRHCRRTSLPFAWKSAPFDSEREPRAVEFVQRVTDFGLAEGLLVPVLGPFGCDGVVWMGGERLEITPRDTACLHLIAIYALGRVRQLSPVRVPAKAALTAREREVLTWIARGKSAWDIGEILNIAKRTVEEHAQTAFRKLNAVNRAQAVAIALRDGHIAL